MADDGETKRQARESKEQEQGEEVNGNRHSDHGKLGTELKAKTEARKDDETMTEAKEFRET